MMLSRIAESLFWVGRYLERAEDTARLLDVQIHELLEAGDGGEIAATRLLSVMGIAESDERSVDLGEVTALLAFSAGQPSSIASSLRGARENARGIRESISTELWECLNATVVALDARVAHAQAIGPHEYFAFSLFVRERVAIAAGLADATMSRDDGWRFLVLGRSLERVDMTARLLAAQVSGSSRAVDWVTTLRSCSAHEIFLRTYRGAMTALNVVEFLMLDRYFPRSVYFALAAAQDCLLQLGQERGRVRVDDEALRIIGRARSGLEYWTMSELVRELPSQLLALQKACCDASAAITAQYFQREATLSWRTERTVTSTP